jgi:hypothetical protein
LKWAASVRQLTHRYVRYWPKADMPKNAIDVAIGGKADMAFCTAKQAPNEAAHAFPVTDESTCSGRLVSRETDGIAVLPTLSTETLSEHTLATAALLWTIGLYAWLYLQT